MTKLVDRVASRYLNASTIPVGKTVVQGNLRIHRYNPSIKVTDLTNAGKKGKKVTQVTFFYEFGDPEDLDQIATDLTRYTDISQVQRYADDLDQDSSIKVEVESLRGIDVEPVGQVFKLRTKSDLDIRVSPLDFHVTHHAPITDDKGKVRFYDDTSYWPSSKKDAKIFYSWVSEGNQFKLNQLDIKELRALWDKLGVNIEFH